MEKCSICKQDITPEPNGWAGGCNAWPINDGICCKACDDEVVIPARMMQHYEDVILSNEEMREIKGLVQNWLESDKETTNEKN
jgi:hypothetical protein